MKFKDCSLSRSDMWRFTNTLVRALLLPLKCVCVGYCLVHRLSLAQVPLYSALTSVTVVDKLWIMPT